LVDNDDDERLIKSVKAIILNLKTFLATSLTKQQQQQQQQQGAQHPPELHYVFALGYISVKKPNFFLQNFSLIEVI
jgi:hypothetical protein